ncbi:hypothetical protein JCM16106_04890 [Hydrogenophilus islandicus]
MAFDTTASGLAVAGGVGLFLLGLELLSDGLRLAAGPQLQRLLARATDTRWRALAAGMVITAFVQSSSVVTLATIGFVNAGLLSLTQSLWVIFGANVGTTITGWIVSVVGFHLALEAWALPLVTVGAFLHLFGKSSRRGAFGLALAGFGLLVYAIGLLKTGLAGTATLVALPIGDGWTTRLLQTGAGFLLTLLLFSSSAATALILTAVHSGMIDLPSAAAMVIGANLGTSVKAFLAAIGATANAKRAAVGHLLFNALTAAVALVILSVMLHGAATASRWAGFTDHPAVVIALFHTLFNLLGVLLIWPIADPLAHWLQQRFRTRDEDEAQPRYLDRTIVTVPDLAIDALRQELSRLRTMALRITRDALDGAPLPTAQVSAVRALSQAIANFIAEMNRGQLTPQLVETSERLLRVARYYESAVRFAEEGVLAFGETDDREPAVTAAWERFHKAAHALLAELDLGSQSAERLGERMTAMEAAYQSLKETLLAAGSRATLSIAAMDAHLRAASSWHRALQQLHKAALWTTSTPLPSASN